MASHFPLPGCSLPPTRMRVHASAESLLLVGESDTQIKKCTSRNHIESFKLFYWLKKKRSPFVDFCALISVGYEPNAPILAMEMRPRARDGLGVPIPDTPVREPEVPFQQEENGGIPNGSSEGGREIIGQEMVIHRTLQIQFLLPSMLRSLWHHQL